jgi:hypothetical protein
VDLHPSNVLGSPGSTWAGLAGILAVVSGAVNHGIPVDVPGWIGFTLTIISGIGAIFSRA